MKKTGFVYSPEYLKHETGENPENASRLLSIINYLKKSNLYSKLLHFSPPEANIKELSLIHNSDYIQMVSTAYSAGVRYLDPDTPLSKDSYGSALLAAGGVVHAVDLVLSGATDNAFCAVRPPGHHAEQDHAMGFCIFNNAAIGARYATTAKGLKKVFILDWDAHHGNGTQNAFYNDPRIFYTSMHQSPHFPGTGRREDIGQGEGKGFTKNFPFPAESGDQEYLSALEKEICSDIIQFQPELIIVSAGFDAHIDDPLASIRLTSDAFKEMTEILVRIATEVCQGRIVSVLEGGYNMKMLGESVGNHLSAMLMV